VFRDDNTSKAQSDRRKKYFKNFYKFKYFPTKLKDYNYILG